MTQVPELTQIKKRNGRVVEFDSSKISNAINKALIATGKSNDLLESLTEKVIQRISHGRHVLSVEDVQDIVESVLIEESLYDTAKAYILYRHEKRKIRDEKMRVLNKNVLDEVDELFDLNSLRVLASRYLLRDGNNQIIESPKQLFERVAITVGIPDVLYDEEIFGQVVFPDGRGAFIEEAKPYFGKLDDFDQKLKIGSYYLNKYHFEGLIRLYIKLAKDDKMKFGFKQVLKMIAQGKFAKYGDNIKQYYDLMVNKDFLPNTPTLMNAGAKLGQLSACFVLDIKDDMEQIMDTAKEAAMIFKSGGGVGINYSNLRPEGDIVASTSGVASGPTSFMNIIDAVTNVVKQGGKRRGANMGILDDTHPDIEKFITAKTKPGVFENFNVSVGIHDVFWDALTNAENHKYALVNPRTKKELKQVDSHQMIDLISLSAWNSAEPGVIFFDNINMYNPNIEAMGGPLRATNPCGEQSLYPYESCNLGSINLANFAQEESHGTVFDWKRYEQIVRLCTRFLDNIIDMNKYPVEQIDINSRATRRIGLGIMGLADLLFLHGYAYNSDLGYGFMNDLAEALSFWSMEESVNLSEQRNPFPLFERTKYKEGMIPVVGFHEYMHTQFDWKNLVERIKEKGIRNSWTSTIAPTGTLSMLADTSNGVEPVFSAAFEKRVTVGSFYYTNKILEKKLKEEGIYSEELLAKIANNYGSVKGIPEIPKHIQDVFVTAMDIHWADHIMAQAIWQRWISNAIAKTINMAGDSTTDDVKAAYLIAHELGLKGVTVYRDGSRHEQVLHVTGNESKEKKFEVVPSTYTLNVIREAIDNPYILSQIQYITGSTSPEIDPSIDKYIPTITDGFVPASKVVKEISKALADIDDKPKNGKACPDCKGQLVVTAGCNLCIDCGFSSCSVG